MKKVFLALMAVAAISLTGCDKSGGEPGKNVQAMACRLVSNATLPEFYDIAVEYTLPGEQPQTEAAQWTTESGLQVFNFSKEVPSKGKASFKLVYKRNGKSIDTEASYPYVFGFSETIGTFKTLSEAASACTLSSSNSSGTWPGSVLEEKVNLKLSTFAGPYEYTFN